MKRCRSSRVWPAYMEDVIAQLWLHQFNDCSELIGQFWDRAEGEGDDGKLWKLYDIVKRCGFDGSG